MSGFNVTEYLYSCLLITPPFLISMTQMMLPFSELLSAMFIKSLYKLFVVAPCAEKCDDRGTSVLCSLERGCFP